ncbi:MAG TPA: tetratricopeptide repeat protein, partial [Candidatus Binatia bacterium]|nr:tetratricopeptide repeat protein [Candidatus Binatia bacterium]
GRKWLTGVLQGVIMGSRFAEEFPAFAADILKNRDAYFYTGADLNGLGYFLMQQLKNVDGAIAMFELYTELFPQDWNAYDSLAEGWYTKGDKQKALKLYQKSLELNPASESGKKFVERINKELGI